MEILVFGLENENSILQRLRKRFPAIGFKKCDLSQELENEGKDLVVMDTLRGLDRVCLLEDIGSMSPAKALDGSGTIMTLRILMRIGSIRTARVIGVPEGYPEDSAFEEICALISGLIRPGS